MRMDQFSFWVFYFEGIFEGFWGLLYPNRTRFGPLEDLYSTRFGSKKPTIVQLAKSSSSHLEEAAMRKLLTNQSVAAFTPMQRQWPAGRQRAINIT